MKLRVLLGIGLLSLQAQAWAATTLTTPEDKVSYTIGADIGQSLKKQDVQIKPELVAEGLKDAYTGGKLQMTADEMKQTIADLQKQVIDKQQEKLKSMADKNATAGQQFLTANKAKPGIVTLPSGLQYKVVTAGNGVSPNENSTVKVDYEGKLLNGKVFDSTFKRGEPVEFKVSQVIPGWQEALQKMKMGATWQLFIPAKLAYGERGFMNPGGTSIEPNETLIFKVHLISVKNDATMDKTASN